MCTYIGIFVIFAFIIFTRCFNESRVHVNVLVSKLKVICIIPCARGFTCNLVLLFPILLGFW